MVIVLHIADEKGEKMGVLIIDENGNEIENTYNKKDKGIRRDDYRPPEPQLEITPTRREEPRKIPYVPFINPIRPEKSPSVDKDFGVYMPYKKVPRC